MLAGCVSRRRIKQYVVATGAELFTQCSDEPTGGRAGATFLSSFYAQTGLATEWSKHLVPKQTAHHEQVLGGLKGLQGDKSRTASVPLEDLVV